MNVLKDLINLIKEGESERAKQVIQISNAYHVTDALGASLLHYAAYHNNVDLTQFLLNNGCDINTQNSMGTTPLMISITGNCEAVMKILLSSGANIFTENQEKKSALNMVSEQYDMPSRTIQVFLQELRRKCSSSKELAEKLVLAGFPIYQVVLLKDFRILEYVLRESKPVALNPNLSNKITGVHLAVILNDLQCVNVLLKHGFNPDALDTFNENPLYNLYKRCSEHNNDKIEILKVLLKHKVSMTSCTRSGVFHAYYVLTKGNNVAVRTLLESGIDFNAKDSRCHQTVLHYLSNNTNPKITEELKPYVQKLDFNVLDKYGQSPLLISVLVGNVSMVKFLLMQGVKTELKHSIYDTTPLYYAYERTEPSSKQQYSQCGQILLQYNAEPQFVIVKQCGKKVTIFDDALEKKDFNRIKPVIAHLALHKKLGTPITKITWIKINSHNTLKKYFEKCTKLLKQEIYGRVILFNLLVCDKRKMAQYLNNKSIAQKLQNQSYYKQNLKSCPYYYHVLYRRFMEGQHFKTLKNESAIVICKIFQNCISKTHLIVSKIIDYLDDQSLQQLCHSDYELVDNTEILSSSNTSGSKITEASRNLASHNCITIKMELIGSPDKTQSL